MYRRHCPSQLSFENFYLPFGGKLSGENRWVKLAEMIRWEEFEAGYAQGFSQGQGAPAKTFRMALGALIIKEKLGTSDEETVEQIRENPYLQYFLGLSEYQEEAPFDPSMLVHFRKRISLELVGEVNEAVVASIRAAETKASQEDSAEGNGEDDDDDGSSPPNQGQLLIDATCAPVDIHYPTDLRLVNNAREASEEIIDALYEQLRGHLTGKPRTYRRQARRAYLAIAKQRRVGAKQLRKAVGQQLRYVQRNLKHIDRLIAAGASLAQLSKGQYRTLLVISELFRQQQQMYQSRTRRIDHRIVSLAQPHVRPIVRGKAGSPVEFGPKLSASCSGGYVFLDHLSWENFNESKDLTSQVEAYRQRFGYYPASVHADQIYRTRANRAWCKAKGIRLSGPPLGRPVQNPHQKARLKRQAKDDERARVAIEGKFGQAKRRFSLGRVMAKLAETAATSVAITFLVLNLERGLRLLWLYFFSLFRLSSNSLALLFRLPWRSCDLFLTYCGGHHTHSHPTW